MTMAGLTPNQREDLFRSGQYSDFRITCNGSEFLLHRNVICTASDYMRVVCERDFKVSIIIGLLVLLTDVRKKGTAD